MTKLRMYKFCKDKKYIKHKKNMQVIILLYFLK